MKHRVDEMAASENLTLYRDKPISEALGVDDWGPIQTSLLMKKYPDGFNWTSSICRIVDQKLNYKLFDEMSVQGLDEVKDFAIKGDKMFFITDSRELVAIQLVKEGKTDEGEGNLRFKRIIESSDLLVRTIKEKYGRQFDQAGLDYHPVQNKVYIVTEFCIAVFDLTNSNINLIDIDEDKELVYVDILDDYLFVANKNRGVAIYSIKDPAKVKKLSLIDRNFFGKSESDTFRINDFDIHPFKIEIVDKNASILDQCLTCNDFFKVNFTSRQRNDYIRQTPIERKVMFIAESEGIFAMDITELLASGKIPTKLMEYHIPVVEPLKLERYHEMLYVLLQDSEIGEAPHVAEIFLTDAMLSAWDLPSTDTSRRYILNRGFTPYSITNYENLYADEDYIYIIGSDDHEFYERGINSTFVPRNYDIGRGFLDDNLLAVSKFIVDGEDFLATLNVGSIALYKVRLSSPRLECELEREDTLAPEGVYEFDLNVTTRSCPTKLASKEHQAQKFANVCVFRKTFTITASQVSLEITETKRLGLIVIVAVFCLFSVLICSVLWFYRRQKLAYKDLFREYQFLQSESSKKDSVEFKRSDRAEPRYEEDLPQYVVQNKKTVDYDDIETTNSKAV